MTPTAEVCQYCPGVIQDAIDDILPPIIAPILTEVPNVSTNSLQASSSRGIMNIHLSALEGPCWPGIGATGGIVRDDYSTTGGEVCLWSFRNSQFARAQWTIR